MAIRGLKPRERVRLSVTLSSAACGRWMVFGFRLAALSPGGLLTVANYVPTSVPVKFAPDLKLGSRRPPLSVQRASDARRLGVFRQRRRGFGSDFRELRDHTVGDPFRSIAWKATARTGRLMVREFEDEVVATTFVILDISSTMRGGEPPRTKLEHAVRVVGQLTALLAQTQDRIGLITFDEVVYGHLRTAPAKAQLGPIINHLVGLNGVVDPDFTELDDE
jgi:uncharacterized protein (DUF58 family)